MTLEQYIASLLQKNDCVVVPEFGGFVANYAIANIDENKGLIFPPSQNIIFNPKLSINDGLLCSEICKSRQISFPESLGWINESVTAWKKQLSEFGRIEIAEIGFLFLENGQVIFEQNREINVLLEAYGMTPVRIEPVEQQIGKNQLEVIASNSETFDPDRHLDKKPKVELKHKQKPSLKEEPADNIVELDTTQAISRKKKKTNSRNEGKPEIQTKKHRRTLRYLAVAAIVPIAFYSWWIPSQTNVLETGKVQLSDFNPFKKRFSKIYSTRENSTNLAANEPFIFWDEMIADVDPTVSVYNYQFSDDLFIPVALDRGSDNSGNTIGDNTVDAMICDYQVITGCFSISSNAEGLIEDLKSQGFSAFVVDQKGGLHRVSAGGFDNSENARSTQSQLESKGFSSWILKR